MKFKGTIIGQASGSYASNTFSHNRGGQYVRNRAVPVNPNTSFQQVIRGFVTLLTANWQSLLTATQRAAWDVYAEQVPLADTLGEARNAGGLGMYVRSNVGRLQAGLARIDNAPTVFNLGSFTNPTVASVSASADTASIAFTNSDPWATSVGGAMLVFASRPQNASINYFAGPYRFAAAIAGAATPPTSPAVVNLPFPVGVGNRVFFQFRVTQVDGRYSGTFRLAGTAS